MKSNYLKVAIIGLLFLSCQKEQIQHHREEKEQKNVTISDGRLFFQSTETVKTLFADCDNAGEEGINNKLKSMLDAKGQACFLNKEFCNLSRSFSNSSTKLKSNSIEVVQDGVLTPELVPDKELSAILNDKGEVQVGEAVYKVTPFGTFATDENNLPSLNKLLLDHDAPDDITEKIPNHEFYQEPIKEDIYKIDDKTVLIDTYKRGSNDIAIEPTYEEVNVAPDVLANLEKNNDPEAKYNNLSNVRFHAKTKAGGLIEKLWGRDVSSGRYFNHKRRIKTSFYNLNFGLYFSIGCTVEMQKKNWIGWSGTTCEEIRLGWDYIVLDYDDSNNDNEISNTIPMVVSSFPTISFTTGASYKLIDLNLLGYNKDRSFNFENILKAAERNGVRDVTRYYWNTIKGSWLLPPSIAESDKIALKYFPNSESLRICYGRTEYIKTNAEKISRNFERGDFGSIVLTGGSFLFLPSHSNNYYLTYASIYGIAKFDNKWLGSRIICDKE